MQKRKRFGLALAGLALTSLLAQAAPAAAADQPQAPAAGQPSLDASQRLWQDESIYFVFLDRFHDGDKSNDAGTNPADPRGWHGGDIQGVTDKLDYIKSMGFTAIWITPFVKNDGNDYHGYGATDFFQVDPHFGTLAQLKELVNQAHARGMKVLFDVVVNHTGPNSPLTVQHPDWFHPNKPISDWNNAQNVQNGWLYNLPDFDQSNPAVRDYILSYSKYWIEQTGVDGFRLDTVRHVAPDFWTWYNAQLQQIKPGFWLIGEVFDNSAYKLPLWQNAGVTALLDFPDDAAARSVFGQDAMMTNLSETVRQVADAMPNPYEMGAFLDNHDMTRFVSNAKQDDPVGRLKLGLEWLFTQRSIPIMYYGTEVAMPGKDDPDNRHDFPWENPQHTDVRDLITRLNAIRQAHLALRRGSITTLAVTGNDYAYARVAGNDKVVVVLNNDGKNALAKSYNVSALGLKDGTTLRDELTGAEVTVAGGQLPAQVGPRTAAIYVVTVSKTAKAVSGIVMALLVVVPVGLIRFLRRRR
ncbi:MAG: alpha-amylase family glycosyl hydrolase, partial [Mycobacterium leprae]